MPQFTVDAIPVCEIQEAVPVIFYSARDFKIHHVFGRNLFEKSQIYATFWLCLY